MEHVHTSFKFSGAYAHECNTVTVSFVHICLYFEYKGGEIFLKRTDFTHIRFSWERMACHLQEVIKENFNTEVCQCRTKKYRCLFSVTHFINIEFSTCTVQKFNIILKCLEELITDHAKKFRRINGEVFGGNFPLSVPKSCKCCHMFCTSIIDTAELFS